MDICGSTRETCSYTEPYLRTMRTNGKSPCYESLQHKEDHVGFSCKVFTLGD